LFADANQRHSDYSGLPILKAITSASEDEIDRLTRFWIYGSAPRADGDTFPFLFINGGAATLSGSAIGAAMVRDAITQREIQLLEHTCICCFRFSVTLSNGHVSDRWSPHLCDGASWFRSRART
jgi:hypothetical protein